MNYSKSSYDIFNTLCQRKQPPESPFVKGNFPVSKKPISIKNNIPVK
ncbi:MAG: hypothetical protein JETT_3053 [Candidatus Jettenia ecosi]|uniref:Uncharacterized protein n=1 Tax=Candidatus Jettenia ecosi TaxID=2494326 RepID=A0A533Q7W0_9BACT|nr:MAG: hypothetical protein JETT_3053 [Candidatus Jettenia ecosi]